MAPGVAGNEEALDADAVDLKGLAVVQQDLLIADGDLRQLIERFSVSPTYSFAFRNRPGLSASTAPT